MGSDNQGSPLALRVYIALLSVCLAGLLAYTLVEGTFGSEIVPWLLLVLLFGIAEYTDLLFHHEKGRLSLSPSEAVLLPMLVGLSFGQVVWGVSFAVAVIATFGWKVRGAKWAFNVSEYGVTAAVAAIFWANFNDGSDRFTVRNAVVAALAVLVFGVLSHLLVAGAISLAERRSYLKTVISVASTAGFNLVGSAAVGLLFAASYLEAQWTVVLFAIPLASFFLGYRAFVRQRRERERVEQLHSASRALAASTNFEDAVVGFIGAMREIVSSSAAQVILNVKHEWFVTAVQGSQVVRKMEPVEDGPLLQLVERFRADPSAVVVSEDAGDADDLLADIGARSFVGVSLLNGDEFAGCLLAIDRVGADEFSDSDAKLLEALGNELVLTLDSYRLFAQVAEERERFQQIFDGSKEGICLLDEEGVIRAWNPALARITGFEEEDIIGELWSERVLVRDRYHRRVEGMDIVTVPPDEELELVTRQGPPRWVSIMSGEVPTEDKKSWVLLVRDITAEHELEESKSDFLSTISHELRTPLTTIKGSLQVLSRPNASANSEIGKQMVEIMKRGSDRLERLVMNLLAVSQMESGDVQVYPDEVPLEDLVRSRIASVLPDHPQVEVEVEEDLAVRADRERLAQAIEHLLDNARKFGPESGMIRVQIAKENGYARLSVSDEGPGIPKIDQERIFDRFVRLGHVLTRETQGPGVGLFIVKKSIEAMSGSVEVESGPHGGATFHLRIPLAYPMAAIDSAS